MRKTIVFPTVTVKAMARVECSHPDCKKMVQRTKKFEQTINPFNKDLNGQVKSERQIREELIRARDKWLDEFTCSVLFCRDHSSN